MLSTNNDNKYNVILLGQEKVGKTTYIKKLLHGNFETDYVPTVESNVFEIKGDTGTYNIWDTSGKSEYYDNLDIGFHIYADFAIIMFDYTNNSSLIFAKNMYNNIQQIYNNIPVVLCGNKCEDKGKCIDNRYISKLVSELDNVIHFYPISTKTSYQLNKPIDALDRYLQKH